MISSKTINKIPYKFYDGLDFNLIKNHSKDGTDGFIVFFIKNWRLFEIEYNRNITIYNILNNDNNELFNWSNINNYYVLIYQCENIEIQKMYEYVIENIEVTLERKVWVSVVGLTKGAWDLTMALVSFSYSKNTNNIYEPYKKRES